MCLFIYYSLLLNNLQLVSSYNSSLISNVCIVKKKIKLLTEFVGVQTWTSHKVLRLGGRSTSSPLITLKNLSLSKHSFLDYSSLINFYHTEWLCNKSPLFFTSSTILPMLWKETIASLRRLEGEGRYHNLLSYHIGEELEWIFH